MNWEPSMDPYELRESIGENLEETCQHGDKAFPCACLLYTSDAADE